MSRTLRLAMAGYWRVRAFLAGLMGRTSSRRRVRSVAVGSVLVVCYGNIYRSAFVEKLLKGADERLLQVRSAGFHEVEMRPAPPRLVQISRRFGIDLSEHRSSIVTQEDLDWADLILLMDRKNWVRLRRAGADPKKLVWLGAFVAGSIEIEDPYEMDDQRLEALLERLWRSTHELRAQMQVV